MSDVVCCLKDGARGTFPRTNLNGKKNREKKGQGKIMTTVEKGDSDIRRTKDVNRTILGGGTQSRRGRLTHTDFMRITKWGGPKPEPFRPPPSARLTPPPPFGKLSPANFSQTGTPENLLGGNFMDIRMTSVRQDPLSTSPGEGSKYALSWVCPRMGERAGETTVPSPEYTSFCQWIHNLHTPTPPPNG